MLGTRFSARLRALALTLSTVLLSAAAAAAEPLTVAWDANPEPHVQGYYVYIGTSPGVYSVVVDVGNTTSYTYPSALPGTTYYLTVAAYAAGPLIGQQAPEIVASIGSGPSLTHPGNQTNARGESVSLALSATDPDSDPITFGAFGLPPGLTVNPTTGIITGTPTTAGTFNASVTATDGTATSTQTFVWTIVTSDTLAPTVIISGPTTGTTYATSSSFVTLTGTASDDVGVTSISWANSRGGSGTAAGTTSWSVVIPLYSGVNLLTMTARDATGKSSTDTLTVTLNLEPSIAITQPTADSSFSTSAATLSLAGTAVDDNDVVAVTWTSSRGGSGTATGTESWSIPSVALQSGTNVITVTARDAEGRTASVTLTVTQSTGPLELTSLTANATPPQPVGTSIRFTATATGGTSPYQYKWWLHDGSGWSVVQNWSTSSSLTWRPSVANPNYRIGVWIRSAGSTADLPDNERSNGSMMFATTSDRTPLVIALTADKPSPQVLGATVRFSVAGGGGVSPYQFKWRLFNGTSWTVLQDWSASTTLSWTPAVANGGYQVQVWARSAGQSADAAESPSASATQAFVINPPATPQLTVTALAANRVAPQAPGTAILFTAATTGGTTPHRFKWRVFNGTTWATAQDWSTNNTFAWTPNTPGGYQVSVWAKSATAAGDAPESDAASRTISFPIEAVTAPLSLTGLTSDKTAPQPPSSTIRFTAGASGGTAPYSFKFRLFNGSSWQTLRDWSTSDTAAWTPTVANANYRVQVWARSSGSTIDAPENGIAVSVDFPITNPAPATPLSVTTITASKTAPQNVGTSITFTASVAGGVAPYQYKWWLFNGSAWTLLQNWSGAPSYTWTPLAADANYRVAVWVRSADSTADAADNEASNRSIAFPITNPQAPLSLISLQASRTSPQVAGTSITFTTSAAGGTAPYRYKWRVFNGTSWTTVQDWSASQNFVWTPTAPGTTYQVQVWARSASSTADAPENAASSLTRPFTIIPFVESGPLRLTSMTPDLLPPYRVGTPISVAVTATGGVPQYQYKWWLFDGRQWVLLRDWTTSSTHTWTPTAVGSSFRIGVWIRSATSAIDAYDNDRARGELQLPIR